MSSKKNEPRALEADGYAHIEFSHQNEHGTCIKHEADIGISVLIEGLKEDMSHVFGVLAPNQDWFYNTVLLENDKTLLYYGIDGTKKNTFQIDVKRSNN